MTSGHIRTRSAAVLRHAVRALVAVAVTVSSLSAQQPGAGRITGRIIDASSGAGITDAGVQIVGTTLGAASGVDGRYSISNVPAGTVTLQVRRIGFAPKTVTGLLLDAGRTLEQDVTLESAALRLTAQVVTAVAERGTVNEALDRQRTATQLVNSVTSEQIARSPDSDAGQAVQRVSGVTVQDGKYVFVRGLGERYTTTSLNGARLPSPEPERKVVPLDLFPSGLLQSITTTKTFTPDQPGDFSGASVDIRTREFPAQRQFTYSATAGYNTTASKDLPTPRGVGGERFALSGSARDLPPELRSAGNLSASSQDDQNRYINSFRNVWRPGTAAGTPNGSASAALGGNDAILGQRVGYLLSGTYSTTQEVRRNEVRALALEDTRPIDRFVGTTGRSSVLWGGLFNASTLLGTSSRLTLNNTYNRTADNDARVEFGSLDRLGGARTRIERLDYVERSIRSSQLAGEHEYGRNKFDWAATTSGVTRNQPDRSESVYELRTDATTGAEQALFVNGDGEGAVRTFGRLTENSYEGRTNYAVRLGSESRPQTLKFGALYRSTNRDSETRAYGIFAGAFSDADRALQPEQLFDGRFTQPGQSVFQVAALGQGGKYTASDALAAGYAMGDVGFSDRIRFIGGARLERSQVEVISEGTLSATPDIARPTYTDLLPSAAVNVKVSEAQNVRLSVSRTLARPEYRELSGITTRDVIGGDFLRGNPALLRTLIDNADVRWEMYPNPGEVLSVGVFAKRFDRPIERTYQASSNNPIVTFVNADAASNYGIEFEARKGLGGLYERFSPLTVFSNVTLMRSEIRLGSSQAASTNANRRMAGQAPYVVNAGLTYTSTSGATSATALFNRVGERIYAAGVNPLSDVIERPRNALDLSIRFPLAGALSGRLDARNVLDARTETTQGTVVRSAYNTGRVIQAGVTWRP